MRPRLAPADLPHWLLLQGALRHAAREGNPSGWSAGEWWRVLGRLPRERREAVVLVLVRGMRHADAAAYLGCSRQCVSGRLAKARADLAGLLPPGTLQT